MKYNKIREEELKNKVGADWFRQFDTTEIIGNIDFTVFPYQDNLFGRTPLLWAEAKTGNFDVATMFVQLILTIGKARTFDKTIPPAFLGAFDFKKSKASYVVRTVVGLVNEVDFPINPDGLTQARQFVAPLIESELLDSGENMLAHADAVAQLLNSVGAAHDLQIATYLGYAVPMLKRAPEILAKKFGKESMFVGLSLPL